MPILDEELLSEFDLFQ